MTKSYLHRPLFFCTSLHIVTCCRTAMFGMLLSPFASWCPRCERPGRRAASELAHISTRRPKSLRSPLDGLFIMHMVILSINSVILILRMLYVCRVRGPAAIGETFTASSLHRERATRSASSSRHSAWHGLKARGGDANAGRRYLVREDIVLVDQFQSRYFDVAFPVRLNYCADMPDVFKCCRAVHVGGSSSAGHVTRRWIRRCEPALPV